MPKYGKGDRVIRQTEVSGGTIQMAGKVSIKRTAGDRTFYDK